MSTGDIAAVSKLLKARMLGKLVDQTGASWNQIAIWLRQLEGFREAV